VSLTERLEELKRTQSIVRPLNLPRQPRMEKSFEIVEARFAGGQIVSKIDFEQLRNRLLSLSKTGSLANLSLREMRLTASSLFEGNERLADDYGLLEKYFDALRSVRSRMILKRLIHAYFVHFDPSHGGIQRLGAFLGAQVSALDEEWNWSEMHYRYNIFTPSLAPPELAKAAIESTDPRADLARAGLSGQLWGAGLSTYVFLSSLKTIQARLEKSPTIAEVERAIAWVRKEGGGLYFQQTERTWLKRFFGRGSTEIRRLIFASASNRFSWTS
jgi:hypothetical protein